MDIENLRIFLELTSTLSFSKTAEKLFISQSGISKHIQALELELQTKLFDRTKRKVSLTPAGHLLISQAKEIIERDKQVKESLKELSNPSAGTVRIGVIRSFGLLLLPSILKSFKKTYPDAQCLFEQKEEPFILSDLLDGKLDLIITSGKLPKSANLQVESLFADPFYFICHKNNPLSSRKRVTVKDIINETFIISKEHMTSPQEAEHALWMKMGKHPDVLYSLDEWTAMLLYVQAGLGVAIISSLYKLLSVKDVVFIPLAPEEISRKIYLVWDGKKSKTNIAKKFIEHAKNFNYINIK